MKKTIVNLSIIALIVLIVGSCTKDSSNDNSNSNSTSAEQVSNTAQAGDWRISYFFDSDEDETSDFNGYVFTFNEDGTLLATNGTTPYTGTWSVDDNSSSSSSDDDFNIFFPVPDTNKFEDLNDDWDIISVSANRIELTDVSGGNGGVDFLTFEKN